MEKTGSEQSRGYTRRDALKLSGGLASLGAVSGALGTISFASLADAAALTEAERDKMTPEAILAMMKTGNERFHQGKANRHRDFLAQQRSAANDQFPAAVLLTCIDSRAPAEVIMDLGIGDVFNCRVAGNVENDDILGSMEFACKIEGAKVVLVMGHTACGAIKGAIDNAELGNLTGLLAKIKPAVTATPYTGERTSKNLAFVNAVCKTNVDLTLAAIRRRSPVLADLEAAHTVVIAGAMYDLQTGMVTFYPHA
jgi:carbonic anhydrase